VRIAVLDTNVIISASINPVGTPAKIITDWVLCGMLHVVTCPRIVAEYREVVRRVKFYRYNFPPLWLESLIEGSLQLPDFDSWPYPCPDPKDTPFLALAHASDAWLVTGNLKHFPAPLRQGVTVLSPAEYLTHLTAQ
jgi:putative PIN family toxin of toxin-antitoxin system